ncbi:hypothetical protein [Rhizobium sp. ZX09]|uniref:hypothetical protein n=1 Tax=Rhizobium sp. ZX09 TaxID=2291939 RepID=UPI001A99CDE6|nr:hypothetical protein [Rhizobium sp. ZX09]
MTRHRNRFETRKTVLSAMAEEQSWKCDCGTMLEEGQKRYCRSCQSWLEDAPRYYDEVDL